MSGLALFPVYLAEEGFEPPETGTYYLVTKDGIFMRKETKVGSALVPVKGIPWLEAPKSNFSLKLPKIPGRIIAQALTFFRKVFTEYNSESYVTLYYSEKLRQYKLWCPKQKVSHGSVDYDRTDQMTFEERNLNDWQMVGTIHSHCDFSAFHSGTDTGDEASFDGIHITLGHVNRKEFSMCASVAINNCRETLEPENVCSGVIRVASKENKSQQWMNWNDTYFFDFELSDEDTQNLVADAAVINEEWFPKVEKQTYTFWSSKKNGDQNDDNDDDLPGIVVDGKGEWYGPQGNRKFWPY